MQDSWVSALFGVMNSRGLPGILFFAFHMRK